MPQMPQVLQRRKALSWKQATYLTSTCNRDVATNLKGVWYENTQGLGITQCGSWFTAFMEDSGKMEGPVEIDEV